MHACAHVRAQPPRRRRRTGDQPALHLLQRGEQRAVPRLAPRLPARASAPAPPSQAPQHTLMWRAQRVRAAAPASSCLPIEASEPPHLHCARHATPKSKRSCAHHALSRLPHAAGDRARTGLLWSKKAASWTSDSPFCFRRYCPTLKWRVSWPSLREGTQRRLASVYAFAVCTGRQRSFGRQACPLDACAACSILRNCQFASGCVPSLCGVQHKRQHRADCQRHSQLNTGKLCGPQRPRPRRTSSGSTSACCTGTSCRAPAGRPG
jgi:hypothetical protein